MGSSYINYQGRGLWTSDSNAELLLYLLCTEIDSMTARPDWLRKAQLDWQRQASVGFMGCVSPSLDQHLGEDSDRIGVVILLASRVRRRLEKFAPVIPKDVVNTFGVGGGGSDFTDDVPTDPLLRVVDAFLALLRSETT